MLNLDSALRIYTDELDTGKPIDMDVFKNALDATDYQEFLELIPMIEVLRSQKQSQSFQRVFAKVDQAREQLYSSTSSVASFRSQNASVSSDTQKLIDEIFDEEFNNDRP